VKAVRDSDWNYKEIVWLQECGRSCSRNSTACSTGKEMAEATDKSNFKSLNKWLESFKTKKGIVSWNICG